MNEIKTKGFYVTSFGDPSVGINDATWTINGGFFFTDDEEIEEFKKGLLETFGLIADNLTVCTFEEYDEEIENQTETGD
jgi:hypothetical protein